MSALRWFCVYRSDKFVDHGVRVSRAFGGKGMRCYFNLDVVRLVARKWLPAVPDAVAFIYEVFAREGDPPIDELDPNDTRNTALVAVTGPTGSKRQRRWAKPQRRTRLVLLEVIRHPEEKVVALTEKLLGCPYAHYRKQQQAEDKAWYEAYQAQLGTIR